jgi:type I restriction enzyme, S subunit
MQYLIDVQTGIGVPHISGQQILDFEFRKPSIKEQRNVVNQLDSLKEETKKLETIYRQKINDLEELKKSILQKAFSGELPTWQARLKTEKEIVA